LSPSFILIHPPISKPCEPPAGVASIAGALLANDIDCKIIDLNIESIYYLANQTPQLINDTWTQRAYKNIYRHLRHLRDFSIYQQLDTYNRAIKDINRVLEKSIIRNSIKISLSNYHDFHLSPIRRSDLLKAMNYPEKNPLHQFWENKLNCLKNNRISGVGVSINYLSQALCGFSIIGLVRRIWPDIPIWVGGGLISSWINRSGNSQLFDVPNVCFVSGPGEPHLFNFFNIKTERPAEIANYDDIYHHQYLSPGFVLPFSASRGCYWRKCAFCPECSEKISYINVPQEMILQSLNILIQKYQPSMIHFLDNALSPKLLKTIIQNPPKVPWYGFTRVTKHLTDPEFCRALKKSGCVMLKLGIESGDQRVLTQMKKGLDISLAQKALQAIHESGIGTYTYFLFGTPYETEDSFHKTFTFMIDTHQWIDFMNLAIFNLPINSREANQLNVYPFYDADLSLYVNFDHPFHLNRSTIRQYIKHIKKNTHLSRIIQNNPITFTSNHAPFFVQK